MFFFRQFVKCPEARYYNNGFATHALEWSNFFEENLTGVTWRFDYLPETTVLAFYNIADEQKSNSVAILRTFCGQWVCIPGRDRRLSINIDLQNGPTNGSVISTLLPTKLLSLASPARQLDLNQKGRCEERPLWRSQVFA